MTSTPTPHLHQRRNLLIGAFALLTLALVSLAPIALARQAASDGDEVGGLLLRSRDGATPGAVRLGTDMTVSVTGQTARVTVTQAFRNTSQDWVEATYLYPLPEDGTVDSLKMVVGQRIILGEINRRVEAQRIYETARDAGQSAGLIEQQRPNMFTNKIANVGPGETVLIEFQYQVPVRQIAGSYGLRLPLVVGPRYSPQSTSPEVRAAVNAPVVNPAAGAPINPVSIRVNLNPGFAPVGIVSPYHRVRVEAGDGTSRVVSLADGVTPANRDFELRWRSAETRPSVSLFRERLARQDYLMAVIVPPVPDTRRHRPPRELVFVIDNSGSMAGESMVQARESLKQALRSLTPADRFNVIRFDDSMTELFEQPVQATPAQVDQALRYADSLDAEGGTEMLPALIEALVDDTPGDTDRVRQVIFLTDGSISNEAEMLAALGADRGRSRVFMVGIGSAPNTYLMSRMAEVGRGTFTHIGDTSEVTARMTTLLDRLTSPVVTNLRVTSRGGAAEFTPADLPDLYEGEPLVVLSRARRAQGTLTVSGLIAGQPWSQQIDLGSATPGQGVAKLWARRRLTDIEVASRLGQMEDADAVEEIARLGLEFSIVTSETSLVAVDHTPRRPAGTRLTREELPLNLPHGWDFDHLFGGPLAPERAADAVSQDVKDPFNLPQTATGWMRPFGGGLALVLGATIGLLLRRRRRSA